MRTLAHSLPQFLLLLCLLAASSSTRIEAWRPPGRHHRPLRRPLRRPLPLAPDSRLADHGWEETLLPPLGDGGCHNATGECGLDGIVFYA